MPKRLRYFFLSLLILPISTFGQAAPCASCNFTPLYQAQDTVTLAASSETLTVQEPATSSNPLNAYFQAAWVYCSVACSFTLQQNCTVAASTTAASIAALNGSPPSTIKAFTASNIGATCTFKSAAYEVSAGATYVLDLSRMRLNKTLGTGQNLSIVTSSITGNAIITIQWSEVP
jgi:hypothetical protein